MANHKFTVRYDGRDFLGWQRHKDKSTIQGTIEAVLSRVYDRPIAINGAGRTDRGAHAEGQVFNADLPGVPDVHATRAAVDDELPPSIRIVDIELVADDFHARSSARGKIYRYEIWNSPQCPGAQRGRVWHIPGALEVDRMHASCGEFVGERDFASFATKPNFKQKSTRRDLRRVDLTAEGERISIVFEADGFLYKMVRNIVRAIVKVGEGRTGIDDLEKIIEACDRQAAPGTAPASGLYLDAVHYE